MVNSKSLVLIGSIVTIVVDSLFAVAPAQAASTSPSSTIPPSAIQPERFVLTPDQEAQLRADTPQVELLQETAVTFADGELRFDPTAATAAGVPDRIVDDYSMGLAIARGESPRSIRPALSSAIDRVAASCRGKNETGIAVWGHYAQLDSCNTSRLIGLISSGAGVAAIAALITSATGVGALVGGLVAGILTIGAGAVTVCSADENGVVLRALWTGTPYCTGP